MATHCLGAGVANWRAPLDPHPERCLPGMAPPPGTPLKSASAAPAGTARRHPRTQRAKRCRTNPSRASGTKFETVHGRV
eukprot:5368106-Alexandrium_andersonii.AAC.1